MTLLIALVRQMFGHLLAYQRSEIDFLLRHAVTAMLHHGMVDQLIDQCAQIAGTFLQTVQMMAARLFIF